MSVRFACSVLVVALAACSGDASPTAAANLELARAKLHWAQTAPAAYQITVGRSCFCPPEITRPVIVNVRDGQVESRRYEDTGLDVDPRFAGGFPTVDGLFRVIEQAIAEHAATVDVLYDLTRGFPKSIQIDGSPAIADDEDFYGTRDFVVR